MIKAAQEKEELHRKENELKAKKQKSQKELAALVKQLEHLKGRNQNLNSFSKNKGASKVDFEQQKALEDQYRTSADNLLKRKGELDSLKKDYDSEMQRFGEISAQVAVFLCLNWPTLIFVRNSWSNCFTKKKKSKPSQKDSKRTSKPKKKKKKEPGSL